MGSSVMFHTHYQESYHQLACNNTHAHTQTCTHKNLHGRKHTRKQARTLTWLKCHGKGSLGLMKGLTSFLIR
uniref:Uncharacterized protein n=1 Tax=Pararge aegeria TaxID=116150 RepID=S4P0F9_9NEOP